MDLSAAALYTAAGPQLYERRDELGGIAQPSLSQPELPPRDANWILSLNAWAFFFLPSVLTANGKPLASSADISKQVAGRVFRTNAGRSGRGRLRVGVIRDH